MNNLKQIGYALMLYANDNEGWSPDVYTAVAPNCWNEKLLTGGYLPVSGYNVLICPSNRPKSFSFTDKYFAYGMRRLVSNSGYSIQSPSVKDQTGARDFGSPLSFLFIGDTVVNCPTLPQYDRRQWWDFFASTVDAGGVGVNHTIHLRHNKRGNFLFGDGHVNSLGKNDLVGKWGASDGSDAFVSGVIDESSGF